MTLNNDQAVHFAVYALVFGGVVILIILLFLYLDRVRSFNLFRQIAQDGAQVGAENERTLEPDQNMATVKKESADPKVSASIKGLPQISVGKAVTYSLVGPNHEAVTADWAAVGDATLSAMSGPKVRVTATNPGVVHLTAAPSGGAPPLSRDVTAVSAAPPTDVVPFLGVGFGTVIISVAVLSVTAALAVTKVLDGQAVAGVLGALVTYSVSRAAAGNNSQQQQQNAGN